MNCLICMLEFPTWKLAKPWSYISGYAFVDALRELGHDVEICLLFNLAESAVLEATLKAHIVGKRRFDFAFFFIPHLNYSDYFWQMAERIAEHRVVILVESLRYSLSEIVGNPDQAGHYLWRVWNRSRWVSWLGRCTHVVTTDYRDYLQLRDGGHSVFWMPALFPKVPEDTFVAWEKKSSRFLTAATLYGRRHRAYKVLCERGILNINDRLQHDRALISEFESAVADYNRDSEPTEKKALQAERVRAVRLALWREYLRYISLFAGIISLPSFFKGFPGRVPEGILAKCAIFICENHDFRRQKRIFLPQKHIHYISAVPTNVELDEMIEVAQGVEYRKKAASIVRERAFELCEATLIIGALIEWARSRNSTHRVEEVGYEAC